MAVMEPRAYDRYDSVPRSRRSAFVAECKRRFPVDDVIGKAAASLLLGVMYEVESMGRDAIEWLAWNDEVCAWAESLKNRPGSRQDGRGEALMHITGNEPRRSVL